MRLFYYLCHLFMRTKANIKIKHSIFVYPILTMELILLALKFADVNYLSEFSEKQVGIC